MPTFTKGIDLYRFQKEYFAANVLTAIEGHALIAREGENDLKLLLSGSLTPQQTRGAFARGVSPGKSTPTGRRRQLTARQLKGRGLRGSIPLNPVNEQSGELLRGVRLKRKKTLGALQEMDLEIDGVPYAKFVLAIGGTRYMVARQVQSALKRSFGPRNKAFFDHFVRKTRL